MFPLRTVFKWNLDEKNRCTAIQTKNSVLEVKRVINGTVNSNDKYKMYNPITQQREEAPAPSWFNGRPILVHFTDLAAWYASLPSGGKITIEQAPPNVIKTAPFVGTNDSEKLLRLSSRFRVCNPKYHYKQKAFIIIGDSVNYVWAESTLIEGTRDYDTYIRVSGSDIKYKTFAEIGDCLNADGKPKITVAYRKMMIPVAHLF
jgi:hypothetical protein